MKSRITVVVAVALALLVPSVSAIAKPGPKAKVDVCHIPPGNPGNAHTINVNERALDAHLGHGDTEGPCPVERPGRDDDTDTDSGNRTPVARAGDDRCVIFGSAVGLDGSASSDPDGDVLAYDWDVVQRPTGSTLVDGDLTPDDSSSGPSFVPDRTGTFRFGLDVSDPDGATDSDSVDISIRMAVGLDRAAYSLDEGGVVAVFVTLNQAAPADLTVDFAIDTSEAVIVPSSTDTEADAVSSVGIDAGDDDVVVYLLGVQDAGTTDESTSLQVTVGPSGCQGSAFADVSVDDDDEVQTFVPLVEWFIREFAGRFIV